MSKAPLPIRHRLNPKFTVRLQNAKVHLSRVGRRVHINWPAKAEHACVPSAIQFHRPVPPTVGFAQLKKHVGFIAIDHATNGVPDEMPSVPRAMGVWHFDRELHLGAAF